MQRTVLAGLLSTVLLQPIAAWAEAPTEATAKAVEEAVKTYGPDAWSKPGLLRVSPDGDGYRLAFDVAKAIADGIAPWTVKDASSLIFKLNEQPDGRWAVDASGPVNLTTEYLAANRSNTVSLAAASKVIKGVFDPVAIFPRELELGLTDATLGLRAAQNSIKFGVKGFALTSTTKDLSAEASDVDADFSLQDVSAVFGTFPQPEVKAAATRIDGTYKLGKLDLAGVGAITRFWQVTAAGKDVSKLTEAERAQLKAILETHTPTIDEIGGTLSAAGVSISEGGKGFSMEKLDYQSRWEGMGGKAVLLIGARVANVGVAEGVWPKGLEAMLPKEAAFNVRASGFDMGAIWKDVALLRTEQEFARLPRDHFSKTLLPGGQMTMDITQSFARSSFYDLTLTGQVQLVTGTREKVSGLFTATARDFDKTLKYLQDNTATVPIFGRFAVMATMIKGFGKPGPDGTTVWEVKFEDTGKIIVNGQPLPM